MTDLICISHLRWDFVWQRPQHLLSRMARYHRILFVEEPIARTDCTEPFLETIPVMDNITVLRLHQPVEHGRWIGHGDSLTAERYQTMLGEYLRAEKFKDPIVWFYTPMGLHFADVLKPKLTVYDVMDELAAFKGAQAELVLNAAELLRRADVVFTGGVSLYNSKRVHNPNTYLFPSGVEIEHFATAKQRGLFPRPGDMPPVNKPVLGYYGVIDERMDLDLLAHLAAASSDWQIVMLGPVVKIDPAELPQAPNLHYLGMKSYAELPCYLAHFDIALIPFAINEATRYLSPTKTLEYMAAHKRIVSTPIQDVISLYGEVVRIGRTHEEFAAHVCEALAQGDDHLREKRNELLTQYTWNSIVSQMQAVIAAKLVKAVA